MRYGRRVIELIELSKAYGGHPAVSGITLTVPPEETLVLIGPSGCGKSTVLRLIVGLLCPDSGEVRIDGRTMNPASALELRRRIGYVIQEGGLFPHLTARTNVTLLARELGWPRTKEDARLRELADLVRLPLRSIDRFPQELSGGQRQRVALMRALLLDPSVLVMDEPLAALDPMIRAQLQEELRELFARLRKTVLFVTHDMSEAAYLGATIALMREGRIVQRGKAAELLDHPSEPFVNEFLRAQRPRWGALEAKP
jgi:osmoprotectant transport system ATP-binding protein